MFWKRKAVGGVAAPKPPGFLETVSGSTAFLEASRYGARLGDAVRNDALTSFTDDELALAAAILRGMQFDIGFAQTFKKRLKSERAPAAPSRERQLASAEPIQSDRTHSAFEESTGEESDGGGDNDGPIILNAHFLADLIRLHACLATGGSPNDRLKRLREQLEAVLEDTLQKTDLGATYGYLDADAGLSVEAFEPAIAVSGGYDREEKPKLIFFGNLNLSSLESSINIFLLDCLFINGDFSEEGDFTFRSAYIFGYDMKVKTFTLSNVDLSGDGASLGGVDLDSSEFAGDLRLISLGAEDVSLKHVLVDGLLEIDITHPDKLPSPGRRQNAGGAGQARLQGRAADLSNKITDQEILRRIDLSHARITGVLTISGENREAAVILNHCRCEVFEDPG